jgi:hypothetical protein
MLLVQNPFRTPSNNFGIWKEYHYRPSYNPDVFVSAEDLYCPHTSTITAEEVQEDESETTICTDKSAGLIACSLSSAIMAKPVQKEPLEQSTYTNKSAMLLVDWQNTGSSGKSNIEINRLVHEVILHPEFQLNQLHTFNMAWENQKVDMAEANSPLLQAFQHADINISIPSGNKDTALCSFSIPGLYFRKLTALIKEAFESPLSSMFHITPFKMYRT